MAILVLKDKNGNTIPIPALQGEPGQTYIFTSTEQDEVLNKALDLMPKAEEMLL